MRNLRQKAYQAVLCKTLCLFDWNCYIGMQGDLRSVFIAVANSLPNVVKLVPDTVLVYFTKRKCLCNSCVTAAVLKAESGWDMFRNLPVRLQGGPKKLHISICLMLNWYSFVKSQPNFIIFGILTPEYIPNKTMHVLSTSPIACSYTTL